MAKDIQLYKLNEQAPPLLRGRYVFFDPEDGQSPHRFHVNFWASILIIFGRSEMRFVRVPDERARVFYAYTQTLSGADQEPYHTLAQLGQGLVERVAEIERAAHGEAWLGDNASPLPCDNVDQYLAAAQRAYAQGAPMALDEPRLREAWAKALDAAQRLSEKEIEVVD